MSSGSEGLYLSPLSDMSPATSDCLETYFSGGFILFSNYRVCVDFSGSFYFFLICVLTVVLSRVLLMAYSSILLEYVLDSTYS